MMKTVNERQLMRYLHGELPAAEAVHVEEALRRDPALRQVLDGLESSWSSLQLPPVEPAPLGFSTRIAARARGGVEPAGLLSSLGEGSRWVRATAAAALLSGLVVGASLGWWMQPRVDPGAATEDPQLVVDEGLDLFFEESLADHYWNALLTEGSEMASSDGGGWS
ncbi:MAG: hypothetical protein AAGD01_12755 [Acidobacteriota bacterium]